MSKVYKQFIAGKETCLLNRVEHTNNSVKLFPSKIIQFYCCAFHTMKWIYDVLDNDNTSHGILVNYS